MKLQISLILLLCSVSLFSQKTQREKEFIESLLKEEVSDPKDIVGIQLNESPYTINITEEDMSYSISLSVITYEDLNRDGIRDYIIRRSSEGALGGSAMTNSQIIYYIMKNDREVSKKYELLCYAPFSYNILDNVKYTTNSLTADVMPNMRTYMGEKENEEVFKARFVYKDGNLYEASYLSDCEMGKMKDKSIFNTSKAGVVRERGIDMHNYMEFSSEKYLNGDTLISASISGCDNFSLVFYITQSNVNAQNAGNPVFLKKNTEGFLNYLKTCTRYKTILQKMADFYSKLPYPSENEEQEGTLEGTWKYYVSRFNYDEGKKNSLLSFP